MYGNYNNGRGYNRFDDRRTGGRDFNDRGGRGGYRDDRDREPMMDRPFEINEPVIHVATGIKLTVIRYGREQVECRKPDLSSEWFYLYELQPLNESK